MLSQTLTFVAADPPRASWFAAWDPDDQGGLFEEAEPVTLDDPGGDPGATDAARYEQVDVELVLPATRGTARSTVKARRIPLTDALDELASLSARADASDTAHAWAAIIRVALGLIADGRVLPWISPAGWDTWRVDPLNVADRLVLEDCIDALPAAGHATPGPARATIADPEFTIRSLFDAVADALIRTPAAHRVGSLQLFADQTPTRATHLRPWVNDLAIAHCASTRLVLRLHPPTGDLDDPERELIDPAGPIVDDEAQWCWRVRFQLQSPTDPSLIIDALDLWSSPTEVMARLGEQAEVTLLSGLRTVAALVPPLDHVLDDAAPTEVLLRDEDLELLIDKLDELADASIEVGFPSEFVSPKVERRLLVTTAAPQGALGSVLDLDSVTTVDWEFLLDGIALTADELAVLGDAKRGVVPIRGKWVRLDAATRRRIQRGAPTLSTADLLGAALSGEIDPTRFVDDPESGGNDIGDDEHRVEVVFEGEMAHLAERLTALTGEREQVEPEGLDATLRPYQRRGLAWMSDLCDLGLGGCLADDMGLGKTIQVLALHAHRGGPTLVVCPTSVLTNWAREAERFIPGTTIIRHHGASRSFDALREAVEADTSDNLLVITTYGVLRSDAAALGEIEWNLVVADEAQHAKNPNSRTARALRSLHNGARLALTGTPVENRLTELWSILDWAVPGLLGPLEVFRHTMATPIERDNDRKKAVELRRTTAPFLLRRRKVDPGIAPELPPKLERDVVVPLTPEQVTLYRATVDVSLAEVKEAEGIARRGLVLKLLTALKQISNHPAHYLGQTEPLAGRSGKLAAFDELVDTASANDESMLVFSQYVSMAELLEQHLASRDVDAAILHGGLSINQRTALVDRFQSGELKILILSLKAGGTGLNLTGASHVVHYDRWWNPAVEDQATDRAWRIGQDKTVTVHRMIASGTVEDRVAELLDAKRSLADKVVGSGESWIGDLDDDELSDLVSLEVGDWGAAGDNASRATNPDDFPRRSDGRPQLRLIDGAA